MHTLFKRAADECCVRSDPRRRYWLYAARIGAELYRRLNEHDAARRLYEAVVATNALPWARLGLASADIGSGQLQSATHILDSLISDQPTDADAYDVMGRVQVAQGDLAAALSTYRKATDLTPSSIARLQKQGMLAFYLGEVAEAEKVLERAAIMGLKSKMLDCQTLVLVLQLQFDKRDTKAFMRTYQSLAHAAERDADNRRLGMFHAIARAFRAMLERRVGDCVSELHPLAAEIRTQAFDFESATNVLSVLARVANREIRLADGDGWVDAVAQRSCVSRAATELLCLAARTCEPFEARVHEGCAEISRMAERAMTHSLTGDPAAAVKALGVQGSQTLNAKLIDLASLVLNRHAAKIASPQPLAATIEGLQRQYCTKGPQLVLGGSTGRESGSLALGAGAANAGGTPTPVAGSQTLSPTAP